MTWSYLLQVDGKALTSTKIACSCLLTQAVKEDFIDQHAVSSIKEKLPHVMPVSCYRLGIDGANIIFQSKVSVSVLSSKAVW